MIKAVNIVNVFISLNLERTLKIKSNSVIAVKTSLMFMGSTHIHG